MKRVAALCASGLVAASGGALAQAPSAQAYPGKPIRLVVTFAAGGPTDFVARVLAAKLTEAFGQPVVVDVRAGASGMIGSDYVAKSVPDGYTLLYGTSTSLALAPPLARKPLYDPIRDFAPVGMVVVVPQLLLVNKSLPVNSVKQLVALAKARPGQLNYGSGGTGSTPYFGMELLKLSAGIDVLHVPYKGLAPALTDLMGGQIMLVFHTMQPSVLELAKNGRLRIIAISSAKRSPAAPNVPTVAEAGVPGFENVSWHAMFAPAKTPPDIIGRLNAQLVRTLSEPDMEQRLGDQGAQPSPGTPESLARFLHDEIERVKRVMQSTGLKPE